MRFLLLLVFQAAFLLAGCGTDAAVGRWNDGGEEQTNLTIKADGTFAWQWYNVHPAANGEIPPNERQGEGTWKAQSHGGILLEARPGSRLWPRSAGSKAATSLHAFRDGTNLVVRVDPSAVDSQVTFSPKAGPAD